MNNLEEKAARFEHVKTLDFSDKVVLVTGSGSGIGAETVRLFSYLGGNVIVTDIIPELVKQGADQCRQLSPKKLEPCQVTADLTVQEDIEKLVNETIEKFGKIDILVNVAGFIGLASVTDQNYFDVFNKITAINLEAVLHLIQATAPHLKKTKGSIINIASISHDKYWVNNSAYAMSKASIVEMTRCFALELGPDIRVNCISPGCVTGTGLMEPPEDFFKKLTSTTALGRLGTPLDIAKAIVFLASPLSDWINGTNLTIDGGFYGDPNF